MIGYSNDDMEAGLPVGCRALLVRTERGREAIERLERFDGGHTLFVEDGAHAHQWIILRGRMASHSSDPVA